MWVVATEKMGECFLVRGAMTAESGEPRLSATFLIDGACWKFVIHELGQMVVLVATMCSY